MAYSAREEEMSEEETNEKEINKEETNEEEKDYFHSGFVTLLGRTNVGKSTFSNQLLGQKIAIISDRVQTTRNAIHLIYTDEKMQIIFTDTAGLQKPKNALGRAMLKSSLGAIAGADILLFFIDPSPEPGEIDQMALERLKNLDQMTRMLIINKIDQADPAVLEDLLIFYQNTKLFDQIHLISALTGQGMEEVKQSLYDFLPVGPLYYPEDMVTDRSERFVIAEMIREQCLNYLKQEIPYGIYVTVDEMKYRQDRELADIYASIHVEREAHKAIVIGRGGSMLKKIGSQARAEIEELISCQANLNLWVKVNPSWRRKASQVKRLGYGD